MVEVEIIHNGKDYDHAKSKRELLRLPLFRKTVYANENGRLDIRSKEIDNAGFSMCVVRFDHGVGTTLRITAKNDLIFVPILLEGELHVSTEHANKFEIFPLEYSILTLEKNACLKVSNGSVSGCLAVFALRKTYFKGMEVAYSTAREILDGTYCMQRNAFLVMDAHMQNILKYIFTIITGSTNTDEMRLTTSVRTMMAIVLTEIDNTDCGKVIERPVYTEWQVNCVQKVKDHLQKNVEEFPGMEALEMLTRMNQTTLRRVFTTLTGSGIREYWENHRMMLAMQLLSSKKHKPSQIAHMLGFASSQAFNKQFKKHYSVAPSRVYRRSN